MTKLKTHGLTHDEKIELWDWNKERWDYKQQLKVTNLMLKSGLIREKNGIKRVTETNIRKVEIGLNENSMIVHHALSNLILHRLWNKDQKNTIKLKASDKKLIREISLNYKLLYGIFKEAKT